ncbi:MAG: lipid-A-disaccharide synthase [Gammaproteobacteria bacterium]|nr:MAG: lipid-A-disaccharide synthase [Gammaproteobacteria bacterium]
MVAGEASGDILGAGLIRALKKRYPKARFSGIGGPLMIAEGMHSLFPMERLSVMGLVEVLGRLRELFGIRNALVRHFERDRPDVFIGIDAPDFNLRLERPLKARGIPTVHYVSPSVWAWRQGRIKTIRKSVDTMLTLFPFETAFYERHGMQARCVGHPLADELPLTPRTQAARERLGLPDDRPVITVMPGSRGGEVSRIGPVFCETMVRIATQRPDVVFVIPAVNAQRRAQIEALLESLSASLDVRLIDGQSRTAMEASDVILLASGTATLEAMLLKKPMVVAYRLAVITYWIMKRLIKVPWVSLPNLLAGRELVPELIQKAAVPDRLASAVVARLRPEAADALRETFTEIHRQLRRDASEQAADAVSELMQARRAHD